MLLNVALPFCDVHDVALAHIRAMNSPQAVSNRHIICSSIDLMLFQDVALILDSEFASQGYKVPLKVAPNFLVKIISIFDKSVRLVKYHIFEIF